MVGTFLAIKAKSGDSSPQSLKSVDFKARLTTNQRVSLSQRRTLEVQSLILADMDEAEMLSALSPETGVTVAG